MTRRILLVFLSLALVLTCVGCGKKSDAGIGGDDFYLVIESHNFQCMTDITEVVSLLGDDYQYAEGKSCAYDGLDKSYIYEAAEFYTFPMESGDKVSEIYTEDEASTTSKGIKVGDSKQAVLDAYGEPQKEMDGLMIYRCSEETGAPSLCFELMGEKVSALVVTVEQM